MKMKTTRLWILAGIMLVLMGAAAWFFGTYTWVDSVRYPKNLEKLDLSGKESVDLTVLDRFPKVKELDLRGTGLTVEEYEKISASKPDCRIRWDVPFQGGVLADDTKAVTVTALTEEDVKILGLLAELKEVDALGCGDYAQLAQLQRNLPEVEIRYEVPVGTQSCPQDTEALVIRQADPEELLEKLGWLPALKTVELQGELPKPEALTALLQAYPELSFSWEKEIGGKILEEDTTTFTISGWKPETVQDLEELLAYGPSLTKLTVLESGLDPAQWQAFQEKHPGVEMEWDISIGGRFFPRDAVELDLSEIPFTDVSQVEKYFPYFPYLVKVDMSHCGLSSEELDALDQRYSDIRVVWTISVSNTAELRTDATYFMPYQMKTTVSTETLKDLKYCRDLICIDLGHMHIKNCEFVKNMPHLKFLILADTPLESVEPLRGMKELVYLEIFMTLVKDYSPLLDCPALLDLNISNNQGDLTPLAQMTWLERLWLYPYGSHRNAPDIRMLQETLTNTQVVFSPYSTGEGWREHPRYYEMRDILGMYYMK